MRLTQMLARPFFGAAWAAIEASSSNLLRQPVPFLNLPAEITIAAQLLARMKKSKTLAAAWPVPLKRSRVSGGRLRPGRNQRASGW